MIRDKIVFGMSDLRIKERLLREKGLDFAKAVDICRAAEASHTQIQSMCKMPLEVNELRGKVVRFAEHSARDNGAVFTRRDAHGRESRDNANGAVDQQDVCLRCGY